MENEQLKDETLNMKDLIGYEDYYKITENGEIFSKRKNRFLRLNYKKNGYVYFETNVNGINKTHRVHRLVAKTFIPNPENKAYINHKDGNKSNNHVDNLEWVTPSENNLHSIQELGFKNAFMTNHPLKGIIGINHPMSKKVNQLDNDLNFIKQWNSISDIERAGIARNSDISSVCKGKRKRAGGFKWEYVK